MLKRNLKEMNSVFTLFKVDGTKLNCIQPSVKTTFFSFAFPFKVSTSIYFSVRFSKPLNVNFNLCTARPFLTLGKQFEYRLSFDVANVTKKFFVNCKYVINHKYFILQIK
jgi:hypothetical protein